MTQHQLPKVVLITPQITDQQTSILQCSLSLFSILVGSVCLSLCVCVCVCVCVSLSLSLSLSLSCLPISVAHPIFTQSGTL